MEMDTANENAQARAIQVNNILTSYVLYFCNNQFDVEYIDSSAKKCMRFNQPTNHIQASRYSRKKRTL